MLRLRRGLAASSPLEGVYSQFLSTHGGLVKSFRSRELGAYRVIRSSSSRFRVQGFGSVIRSSSGLAVSG